MWTENRETDNVNKFFPLSVQSKFQPKEPNKIWLNLKVIENNNNVNSDPALFFQRHELNYQHMFILMVIPPLLVYQESDSKVGNRSYDFWKQYFSSSKRLSIQWYFDGKMKQVKMKKKEFYYRSMSKLAALPGFLVDRKTTARNTSKDFSIWKNHD